MPYFKKADDGSWWAEHEIPRGGRKPTVFIEDHTDGTGATHGLVPVKKSPLKSIVKAKGFGSALKPGVYNF